MSFIELAKKRYSTRNYLPKPVSDSDLGLILEAARVAPTAKNLQPQRLLVIRSAEGLQKLQMRARIYGAPLAIVTCADHRLSWKRPFDLKDHADVDASIVQDHMMLQAAELGLGSVWICWFDPQVLRREFNIPDEIEPISILAIGYEGGTPKSPDRHATDRIPLEKMVVYNEF
ncbi:MAG TPA: nitroreductase [Clostridiales bacterium]|nr:nitroreductase [Clostridiales bacterium]